MKKTLLLLLLMYSVALKAPEYRQLYLEVTGPINPYSKLIYAVNMAEAKIDSVRFDTLAYNPGEGACGAFQIRPCRRIAYNNATGKHYRQADMFNYEISKEIFLFYAIPYGLDYEAIAKAWNGSGPATEVYWHTRVKKWL